MIVRGVLLISINALIGLLPVFVDGVGETRVDVGGNGDERKERILQLPRHIKILKF